MKINYAEDQARPVGRERAAPALPEKPDDAEKAPRTEGMVPLTSSGRRWTVRVHWGIVLAIVASLVLWFAIKTVLGLAL